MVDCHFVPLTILYSTAPQRLAKVFDSRDAKRGLAASSSPEEWIRQAKNLMRQQLFQVATDGHSNGHSNGHTDCVHTRMATRIAFTLEWPHGLRSHSNGHTDCVRLDEPL